MDSYFSPLSNSIIFAQRGENNDQLCVSEVSKIGTLLETPTKQILMVNALRLRNNTYDIDAISTSAHLHEAIDNFKKCRDM